MMYCFLKSLIVIRRYHHFTQRAANHCCQSLKNQLNFTSYIGSLWRGVPRSLQSHKTGGGHKDLSRDTVRGCQEEVLVRGADLEAV